MPLIMCPSMRGSLLVCAVCFAHSPLSFKFAPLWLIILRLEPLVGELKLNQTRPARAVEGPRAETRETSESGALARA